ncbi:MAG TPA: hypothetical protein PKE69_28015, partial [Pyrinomonadaceae bacterium]|nr:hypothetical protein [Pyrinomonadaceae bacterium]
MKKLFLIFSFLSLCFPIVSNAQVSVNVSPLDSVYHDLDKLIGHKLIYRVITNQRPYSRKEIARLTAEAKRNFAKWPEIDDPQ